MRVAERGYKLFLKKIQAFKSVKRVLKIAKSDYQLRCVCLLQYLAESFLK
jgi:hypothetical protein